MLTSSSDVTGMVTAHVNFIMEKLAAKPVVQRHEGHVRGGLDTFEGICVASEVVHRIYKAVGVAESEPHPASNGGHQDETGKARRHHQCDSAS